MAFVTHRRGGCAKAYRELEAQTYDNRKCILLHVRNEGILNPEDVTFNDKTWLENSAELLGVNHECIIVKKPYTDFAYTDRIPLYLKYLESTPYEYALVSDSTDAVIQDNPDLAVDLLDRYDCEILFSTTGWADYDKFTMPERYDFHRKTYGTHVWLNAGVCVGKVSTLIELYKRVLDYAAFEPARRYHTVYRKVNGYARWTKEQLARFPEGCSDDQTIIRYLVKEFWPKIKLDTGHKLAGGR